MPRRIICINCSRTVDGNPRLKGTQKYCRAERCQRARKALWQRNKKADDNDYGMRQEKCQERWFEKRPPDQYMSEYRQSHPDYVKSNRLKQKERNKRRSIVQAVNLSGKTDIYFLKSLGSDAERKIVKMDTLIVQLTPLHDKEFRDRCLQKDCKDGRVNRSNENIA